MAERQKPEWDGWYKKQSWRRLRQSQLIKQPLCQICLSLGIVKQANIVDHVKPHRGNEVLFYDGDNLQSLCKEHHDYDCFLMENGKWKPPIGNDGWLINDEYLNKIASEKRMFGYNRWKYNIPDKLGELSIPLNIVVGAPASGKSTYVMRHATDTDLILDMDMIASEHGFGREHLMGKPRSKSQWDILHSYRNQKLLECMSNTDYTNVWMIGTMADALERQTWNDIIKPKSIYVMLTPLKTCLERARQDNAIRPQLSITAIHKWWQEYRPRQGDVRVGV